jgi:hypothetical protein
VAALRHQCVLLIGLGLPWLLDFNRTETMVCMLGGAICAFFGHIEIRMKVMQLRLATMADELDALRGKEPEDNLILEMNDW